MKGTFMSLLDSTAGSSDDRVFFIEPSVREVPFETLTGQTLPHKKRYKPLKKRGFEGLYCHS